MQYSYYSFVSLCAEVVGLSIFVYAIVNFLMRPYSYHSFIARALQKLYIVQGGLGDDEPHDVKLTFGQKLCFCCRVIFRSCCKCTTDSGTVAKWLQVGKARLDEEFDIIEQVKDLRNIKEIMMQTHSKL